MLSQAALQSGGYQVELHCSLLMLGHNVTEWGAVEDELT